MNKNYEYYYCIKCHKLYKDKIASYNNFKCSACGKQLKKVADKDKHND